jgi:hypothetical protein
VLFLVEISYDFLDSKAQEQKQEFKEDDIDEDLIAKDPKEREVQDQKAAYIQQMYRQKQKKKLQQ